MAHDDQFTALGSPSFTGPGFSTHSASLTHGVNVQGKLCGVYGESMAHGGSREAREKTGVYGTGDHYGVYGITGELSISKAPDFIEKKDLFDQQPGTDFIGIGVVGVGLKRPGVVGISEGVKIPALMKVADPTVNPVGVVGISQSSPGVYGVSVPDGDQIGVGVVGRVGPLAENLGTVAATKAAMKIEKNNSQGAGVYGFSTAGRGGVFATGDPKKPLVAQLQLIPRQMEVPASHPATPMEYQASEVKTLPREGKGGDLLVTTTMKGVCVLWLCVQEGKKGGKLAQWSQVLLGARVDGQI